MGNEKAYHQEWIVKLVQEMYKNVRSRVLVGEGLSEEFEVKVNVRQGSVPSPLLFIIVVEALSREFRAGVPWEDLYADDLVIIADSLEECLRKLLIRKEGMERKGQRVKTKIMIHGIGLYLLQSSGEFQCACHLPHWSRQKQHSMQLLQALGSQEMQWAQVPGRGPQLQVF